MSNNQASSPNYFIPVVIVVLSLVTSVLFSQIFLTEGPDLEPDAVAEKRIEEKSQEKSEENSEVASEVASQVDSEANNKEQTVAASEESELKDSSSDSSPVSPDNADQTAPGAEPVAQAGSEQNQQQEPSDISAIADLTLLVPANDALCDGQNPWRGGDRRLSELAEAPACYGLRFELAKPATVLLLKLSDGAAPRSLLAENCRPFGFNSARFEPEQVQRLPRGVNAQPGVFQVSPAPARTRFVLVAAPQTQEQVTSLETGVANLCGQSATLTNAQVQHQLDALAQLQDVSIKEVQGNL